MSFDDLPLTERARDAAFHLGWREPTPVQRAAIPAVASGKDVIVRAETGSGKTGVFGLVLTSEAKPPGLKVLVLAPTRELVQQITRDLNAMAAGGPFRAAAVYGGVPYDEQLAAIRDPATTCLVATPGRLMDFMGKKQVSFADVRFIVLDEADRMLDLGFTPDVERILRDCPKERQTMLFSATMPKPVVKLARTYLANPREIEPGGSQRVPETSVHLRVDAPSSAKTPALVAFLAKEKPESCIVFVRTRDTAKRLPARLAEHGIDAAAIHGDLTQSQREASLLAFRERRARILVATDVAARGLDIPAVTHVVNFDVPEEAEAYVHRAGRTARAGRGGKIVTLVSEKEEFLFEAAQQAARVRVRTIDLGPLARDEGEGADEGEGEEEFDPAGPHPDRPLSRAERDARAEAKQERAPAGPEHSLPPSRRRRQDSQ